MGSYYSILKYVNNPLSNETIALGLLVVSNGEVHFQISDQKLDLAKKLNSRNYNLLDFTLKQFKDFVDRDSADESSFLIKSRKQINPEFIHRLSTYNNGILQFSKPELLHIVISPSLFKEYFSRFIGEELKTVHRPGNTRFKNIITKKLYDPLKDKIDVDFTLKKNKLDTLFFDFHLDGIGVNGALYAAKAIDFNSNRQLAQIRNDISDFESVIERLNRFAHSRGLSNNHQYCLIIDPYKGNAPSYNDLYSLLRKDNMPLFKILSSTEMDVFVDSVVTNKARKFSEELG